MRPALIFIITTLSQLYLLVMLLRFWMPWLRADFRNPIAQGILRLTSPLVIPVRRLVPPMGRLDTATVIVAFGHSRAPPRSSNGSPGFGDCYRRLRTAVHYGACRIGDQWHHGERCSHRYYCITRFGHTDLQVIYVRHIHPHYPELGRTGNLQSRDRVYVDAGRANSKAVSALHPGTRRSRYFTDICDYPATGGLHNNQRRTATPADLTVGRAGLSLRRYLISNKKWFIVGKRQGGTGMTIKSTLITLSLLMLATACGGPGDSANVPAAQPAEASNVDIGDYTVYFSAMATDQLPPEVARAYEIVRSKNRAMLNVSVLRKDNGKPVAATVTVKTVNLTGQLKNVTMRRIDEGDAIYYIGETPVANRETLVFDISITPEGVAKPSEVRFKREFFTD